MKRVVYSSPGMSYFGMVVARALEVPLFIGGAVPDCDEAYIIGMYDAPYYQTTLDMTKRAKKRIIHWCGTDVMRVTRPDFLPANAVHLCESDGLKAELLEHGIEAEVCTFPTQQRFPVTDLPDEPVISVYYGNNPGFYGEGMVRALMDLFPDVGWHTYGFGQYQSEQMPEVVAQSSVYLRLPVHDGSANSAREFMEGGRRVVGCTDLPYVSLTPREDLDLISRKLRAALKETEPDWEAAAFYREFNSTDRYKRELEEVLSGDSGR